MMSLGRDRKEALAGHHEDNVLLYTKLSFEAHCTIYMMSLLTLIHHTGSVSPKAGYHGAAPGLGDKYYRDTIFNGA